MQILYGKSVDGHHKKCCQASYHTSHQNIEWVVNSHVNTTIRVYHSPQIKPGSQFDAGFGKQVIANGNPKASGGVRRNESVLTPAAHQIMHHSTNKRIVTGTRSHKVGLEYSRCNLVGQDHHRASRAGR